MYNMDNTTGTCDEDGLLSGTRKSGLGADTSKGISVDEGGDGDVNTGWDVLFCEEGRTTRVQFYGEDDELEGINKQGLLFGMTPTEQRNVAEFEETGVYGTERWGVYDYEANTKYKPVGKKVLPVNAPLVHNPNPPLMRPPLSRDPYDTPLRAQMGPVVYSGKLRRSGRTSSTMGRRDGCRTRS